MLKKLLHDNRGDGYIMLLGLLLAGFMLFGGIFYLTENAINLRVCKREAKDATEVIFADIKETAYQELMSGRTINSYTELTDEDVARSFAKALNVEANGTPIMKLEKFSGDGDLKYTITNFRFTYEDDVGWDNPATDKKGDINHDGNVDATDMALMELIIKGEAPEYIVPADADLNHDTKVNSVDRDILERLIDFYVSVQDRPEYGSDYVMSSALIIVTFDIDVPVEFGAFDFGSSKQQCVYTATITQTGVHINDYIVSHA